MAGVIYYAASFLASLIVTFIFIIKWKGGGPQFVALNILVPISNLGYYIMSVSDNKEELMAANSFVYVAGCYLYMIVLYIVIDLCQVKHKKLVYACGFIFNTFLFLSMVSTKYHGLFYKSYEFAHDEKSGVSYLIKEYGPIHAMFYVMIILYLVLAIALLLYSLKKKKNVSFRYVELLMIVLVVAIISFFGGRLILKEIELLPADYVVTQIIASLMVQRITVYDISESVANSIVVNGNIGYFTFDNKYRYLGCNKVAEERFSELKELRIDTWMQVKNIFPEYSMIDDAGNVIESNTLFGYTKEWISNFDENSNVDDYHILRKEGIPYRLQTRPLYHNGKQYGYLFVIMDETQEQAKREEKARAAYALQQLKEAADSANKAKSDFLASMSHEIRTPINAILGMDEMILRESDNPEIREYASNIQSAGNTLLHLINDILDFSKIESGKMELICESYDVCTIFEDLLVMISARAEAKGLKLNFNIDEKIPRKLYGDDVRLRQIITNLLTNAVKYTSEGEITFTVTSKPADSGEDGEKRISLYVEVKDTGSGIKPEDRDSLFEEFARADKMNTRTIEGTGLGLPITKKMLELMDSEILVESEYGKGSIFSFEVEQEVVDETPIGDFHKSRQADIKASSKMEYKEQFTAPEAWVLSVDDTLMNLKVIEALLKKTKINIVSVSSGQYALEEMKKRHFDVILLDHLMPDMDGIETFKKSREMQDNMSEGAPVIALTANALTGAREMYLEEGFTDFLAKPVKGNDLEQMLRNYIPGNKIIIE